MDRLRRVLYSVGPIAVICISLMLVSAKAGLAESGGLVQALSDYASVDWTNGVVRATGLGFPPKDPVSPRQAKLMTKRAARGVALRNLLEALQGVYVDSTTTIKNYMVDNDEIRVKVSGMIEGAKVVSEKALPDGAYETTVEMKLTGSLSDLILPKKEELPPPQKISGSSSMVKTPENYSGLVVDARGTGALPSLKPRILNEEGVEAYSVSYVEAQDLINGGIVVYVADMPAAQRHGRVTAHPLIIKALRAAGKGKKTDIVIRNVDAQTLHVVPEHFEFLEKAKVLVVLDQR